MRSMIIYQGEVTTNFNTCSEGDGHSFQLPFKRRLSFIQYEEEATIHYNTTQIFIYEMIAIYLFSHWSTYGEDEHLFRGRWPLIPILIKEEMTIHFDTYLGGAGHSFQFQSTRRYSFQYHATPYLGSDCHLLIFLLICLWRGWSFI